MNGLAIPPLYGISLFSGIAGLDLGVQRIIPNVRTVCYVEGEMFGAELLHKKMQKGLIHSAPIYSNVVSFPSVAHHFAQKVDFITAGFPCQPFSGAGSRNGINDERWLWDSILQTIRKVRPSFLFLENVSNLLNEWGAFDEISKSLAKIGFNLEWSTVRASDVGANHQRNRLFIFAYKRESLHRIILSHPNSQRRKENVQKIRWGEFNSSWKGVKFTNSDNRFNKDEKKEILSRSEAVKCCSFRFTTNADHHGKPIMPFGNEKRGFIQQPKNHFKPSWWRRNPPFSPICRVDDGISHGMDRLRALGNAVVPLQASWAFYALIQRAFNHPSKS